MAEHINSYPWKPLSGDYVHLHFEHCWWLKPTTRNHVVAETLVKAGKEESDEAPLCYSFIAADGKSKGFLSCAKATVP